MAKSSYLYDKSFAFDETCLFFETDSQGLITFASPKFCTLCGYTLEELEGNTPRIFRSGQTSQEEYARFWQTITKGEKWSWEICNRAKNGDLFWVYLDVIPIVEPHSGQVSKFFSVMIDITERRKAQEAEIRLTDLLNKAQRLESIGQLTSGIAHDFNNILMPVMGFTRLALVFCRNNEPQKAIPCLEKVQESSKRAAALVDKMLIYACEKTTQAEHPISPLSVVDEVVQVSKMLRSGIAASIDICLHNTLTQDAPMILIDASELHQMLTNLVINARDAIDESGKAVGRIEVSLTVEHFIEKNEVYCNICSHELQGDYVVIRVKDSGTGIVPDHLTKLFNPFFTTKEVGKGTGLGLSVVSGILHSNHGHIHVDSVVGEGTIFSLLFPAIYSPDKLMHQAVTKEAKEQMISASSLNICVIDDEPDICELLEGALTLLGYRVCTFNNSVAAQAYLHAHLDEFDVIITDYGMPDLTGLELAVSVLAKRPQLPILFCTGYSDKLKCKGDLPSGHTLLFRKPVDVDELDRAIKSLFH